MKIIAVMAALNALFALSALGLVVSLTRGSRLVAFAPIGALALWPAFMVTSQSFAGYLRAEYFSSVVALGTLAAALLWTAWTLIHHRSDYARMEWTTVCAVAATAFAAGLPVIWPHIWNGDFGYSEFANGEFLNYGQLASFSTGQQTSSDPVLWERHHQAQRDGIDFVNATVALLTRQQPVHIVQLTAALFRTAYLAALLLLVRGLLSGIARATAVTAGIGLVVAVSSLDLFQFEVSFMGAALSLGMAVCAAGLVATPLLPRWRFVLFYVVLNIAMLVSYPESMVVLKTVEILFVGERWLRDGQTETARRWLLGNLATVLVNPLLVAGKIGFAYAMVSVDGGWNVIAEPLTAPITYIARLTGLAPAYQSDLALFHSNELIVALALGVLIIDLLFVACLARRIRCHSLLLIPVIIAVFHLLPYLGLRPHFYSAAKLILAWSWLLPLGVAAAYAAGGRTRRVALAVAVGLFATANAETMRRAKTRLIALNSFHALNESKQAVAAIRSAGPGIAIALDSDDAATALYWFQILDSEGLSVQPTLMQARTFARRDITPPPPSAEASARIVLAPRFVAAWQMPNTDFRWMPLPDPGAGRTPYRGSLLSVVLDDTARTGAPR